MKRTFGTLAVRLLRGGTTLSRAEHYLVSLVVSELPPHLRVPVECQFNQYNLVQREFDRRTLNFYRVRSLGGVVLPVGPVLASKLVEAPLLRLALRVSGESEPLHVVLTAVNGRAFCVSFSRPVSHRLTPAHFSLEKVTQAWQSNFEEESSNAAAHGARAGAC